MGIGKISDEPSVVDTKLCSNWPSFRAGYCDDWPVTTNARYNVYNEIYRLQREKLETLETLFERFLL